MPDRAPDRVPARVRDPSPAPVPHAGPDADPPRPLRVAVVDDEPPARDKLCALLAGRPDVAVVAVCGDGAEAVRALGAAPADVLFLDVRMPEVDGFAVLRALGPARPPAVVFVTAYAAHAVDAFGEHAVDYLLKPYDRARFEAALARAAGRCRARPTPTLIAPPAFAERLAVRGTGATRDRVTFVRVDDVAWFEADGNYVRLHPAAGGGAAGSARAAAAPLLREPLRDLLARLDPARVVRVHRSAAVHVAHVVSAEPWFHGEWVLALRGGGSVTSGRAFAGVVRGLLR
jgi:two-component system LytT family response regulator